MTARTMRHRFFSATLSGLAALALTAATARAATFNSAATGNYNADATWTEAGHPGGNAGADTVAINNGHTITITAANDANADAVAINTGGTLFAHRVTVSNNAFTGAGISLNGGMLSFNIWNGNSTVGGNVTVAASSTLNLINTNPDNGARIATFGTLGFAQDTVGDGFTLSVVKDGGHDDGYSISYFPAVTVAHDGAVDTDARTLLRFDNLNIQTGKTLTKAGEGTLFVGGTSVINGSIDFQEGVLFGVSASAFGTQPITLVPGTRLTSSVNLTNAYLGLPINLDGGILERNTGNQSYNAGGNVRVMSDSTVNVIGTHLNTHRTVPFGTLTFDDKGAAGGHVLSITNIGAGAISTHTAQFTEVTVNSDATIATTNISHASLNNLSIGAGATLVKTGPGVLQVGGTSAISGTVDFREGTLRAVTASAFGTQTFTLTPGMLLTSDVNRTNPYVGLTINLNGGTLERNTGNQSYTAGGNVRVMSDSIVNVFGTNVDTDRIATFGTLTFDNKGAAGGHTLSIVNTGTVLSKHTSKFVGVTIGNDATITTDANSHVELSALTLASGATLAKTGPNRMTISGTCDIQGTITFAEGTLHVVTKNGLGLNTLVVPSGGTLS